MRHFLLPPLPVRLLTAGVEEPSLRCLLIAVARFADALPASLVTAQHRAVPLPVIAPRADVGRLATSVAQVSATIGTALQYPDLQRSGQCHPAGGILESLGPTPQTYRRWAVPCECTRREPPPVSSFSHPHSSPAPSRARPRDEDGDLTSDQEPRSESRRAALLSRRRQAVCSRSSAGSWRGYGIRGFSVCGSSTNQSGRSWSSSTIGP